jgi:hypothetical protein
MNLVPLMIPTLKASLSKMGPGEKYVILSRMRELCDRLLEGDRARVESLLAEMEITKPLTDLLLAELLIPSEKLIEG